MTPALFLFLLLAECFSIVGQISFKHAMRDTVPAHTRTRFLLIMATGVFFMALNFFMWNGLMPKFDLSYLYPFDGFNRVLLVIAASIFLKEKMTLGLWVGVLLICAGILLVSAS